MSWIWSRGSRCGAITSVRSPLLPTRLDGKEQDAATAPPGRRGTRGIRATTPTAVEELAPPVREITLPPRMVLSGL